VVRYRLYLLDTKSKSTGAVDVECHVDEQAFAAARDLDYGGKIEIWQGRRRVGVYKAVNPSSLDDVN
jgi:hypothetical protein